ncbi:LysR family transcriptional regulator [Nonomuraea thailandensis]
MLNLIHLKVLAAVARHGSVTEAARELHYSQPSVSHYLSRLEAATGVKLVQRAGRGIRLTPRAVCWPPGPPRSWDGSTRRPASWRRRSACGRGGCAWPPTPRR